MKTEHWREIANSVKAVLPSGAIRRLLPSQVAERIQYDLRDHDRYPPILVYQMLKVGSSTITRSLKGAGLPNSVYQVHFLSEEGLAREEQAYIKHFSKKSLKSDRGAAHFRHSRLLQKRIQTENNANWLIVTGTREPVSHEASLLFQRIYGRNPELIDENERVRESEALEYLREKIMAFEEASSFTCTWFDKELKTVFDVDVYSAPFKHELGYNIIEKENIKVLVLRQEDLSRGLRAGVRHLLPELTSFRIEEANRSEEKNYGVNYKRVVGRLKLPAELCNRIYGSRYVRHFYSQDMIDGFKQRWTEGI